MSQNTLPCCQIKRRDALRLSSVFATTPLWFATSVLVAQPLAPNTKAQIARVQKIVTVSGAITEVAYLLGAQDQLVGTDTTSMFPEAALKTKKVGYSRQLSAEGLLSLKPDVVIATTEAGPKIVLDQIRSAGVSVELIEADHTWAEVQRKLLVVGRAAGCGPRIAGAR